MAALAESVSGSKGPPPDQMELDLPVLFQGYRPAKKRARMKRSPYSSADMAPEQFDLSALLDELIEEEILAEQLEREINAAQGEPELEPWTLDDIRRLHAFVLDRSLEVLADTRTGHATVLEILHWISQSTRSGESGIAFVTCCELHGYDANELREQVFAEVEQLRGITIT